jgi:DNA repair ATPase RecN
MADDRRKFRRPGSIMSDSERASQPRPAHPQAFPVTIDPEITPPPQAPPAPSSLPGYTTLAPQYREQLDKQHEAIEALTAGLGQVWEARNDADRFDRLEEKVDLLMRSEARYGVSIDNLSTWAKSLIASVNSLEGYVQGAQARDRAFAEHQWPAVRDALERVTSTCAQIVERLNRTETRVDRLVDADDEKRQSLNALSVSYDDHERRIDALEKRNLEEDAGTKATTALVTQSKAKRNALIGGIATAGAGLFAAIQWLVSILRGS